MDLERRLAIIDKMDLHSLNRLTKKVVFSPNRIGDDNDLTEQEDSMAPSKFETSEALYEITQFFISNTVQEPRLQKPSQTTDPSEHNTSQSCTVCKRPASSCCTACSNVEISQSDLVRTFYCGKECQKMDWPDHKKACKDVRNSIDLKMLYRAANLLQNAFNMFRKSAYDLSIKNIAVDNDIVTVTEGTYDIAKVLAEFPETLVKDNDPFVRGMIYSLAACNDQMIHTYDLCNRFLKESGITKKIEEMHFTIKPGPKQWILHREDGSTVTSNSYNHCAYRITMKDGTQYALDLSGAQFGYDKHLVSWEQFANERVEEITHTLPFGNSAALQLNFLTSFSGKRVLSNDQQGMAKLTRCVVDRLAKHFTKGFDDRLEELGWDTKKLLACSGKKKREGIMSHAILGGWTDVFIIKKEQMSEGGFLRMRSSTLG